MLDLQLPARHDWVVQEKNYGKLVMEPFEPGFALTVGIAYRRVLLSAIHGAAPTWVKIERVLHQFSHLPGVTEDTLDIMMNLRKVAFVLHVNRPKILRLKAQGPGTVKASDFEKDADIEILTPEVLLAPLDKDGVLEMDVCVERGRGYVPAEKREPEALPIHAILLDADFSPVDRVNFHVEPAVDGRQRLVFEVFAPGTAVAEALRILEDHFELLTNFPQATAEEAAAKRDETRLRTEWNENYLFRSVDELELSVRASNCLKSANIRTIAELVPRTDTELPPNEELRQEIAQRDHGDPRGDGPVARHAPGSRGARAACALNYERAGEAVAPPPEDAPNVCRRGRSSGRFQPDLIRR